MTLPAFDTLAEAYSEGLARLLTSGRPVPSVRDPYSVASNFGGADRPAVELLGYGFEIRDPSAALLYSKALPLRLDYCFGLLCWSLSGSDDAKILSYYHPAATRFSDDGSHLSGAFGHRLFCHKDGSQIDAILNLLGRDPASRRAVAFIADARDNFTRSVEYPCAVSMHFFVRDGMLHAILHMRAQQALFVLPYDAFLFMSLQSRDGA